MTYASDIRKGWDFMSKVLGADMAADFGMQDFRLEVDTNTHIQQINDAIQKLSDDINNHAYKNLGIEQFKGYVAEEWHADTFNIDAVEKGSEHRAWTLHSTENGSVDIDTNFGKQYSSKYMATPEKTAAAQATFDRDAGVPKYHGQERLAPSDHLKGAIEEANRQAGRNILTRPEISESNEETAAHLTDSVADSEGVASKELTTKEARQIAKEVKKDGFDPEKHGYAKQDEFEFDYIQSGLKAGLTAATITAIMQLVPEMYKAVDYLIKHGEIDLNQLKQSGKKVISASGESFLRGTTAYTIEVAIQKGMLGQALQSVDPSIVGAMVTIVMGTIKNSLLVASGKMKPKEMGAALVDSLVMSAGYLVAAKIGGAIVQALGWEFPGAAYLLGSLIGCSIAAVYNIGKKKLISFCVDTGFTCFGLVEQNYELPEEVLNDIGIDTIQIPRTQISRTPINSVSVFQGVDRSEYETVNITVLRRGVIGVNRVGYVLG